MSISKEIYKSTVRVESDTPGGISVGTAFWFCFRVDGGEKIYPLLVTNKHVVNGAKEVRLRLNINNKANPEVKFHNLTIPAGENAFIMHPDEYVDICVLPIGGWLNEMEKSGIRPEIFFFSDGQMLGENYITPVEDVYMTGYPNGLWDSVNNRPVTRKGITASSPMENWKGKSEFLIDMACFGGSSGSPVYIMNQGSFATDNGIAMGERFIFLGLLYAGPVTNVSGKIEIIDVPTAATQVINSTITMNLGLVIKAEKLNDFKPLLGL
ncbi:S1 family peptidase [Klebsiella quasipneumoniae]|uniref:S1 family peptidase n=1 Tax=Klebsiella quasipneumoniae TaxID=1463165 RepID=UPI0021B4CE6B|nr:serine protease [Klebsiella quasipneumoniae]MCT7324385.1 serine protease [Klebsiella quasipneumoniae]HBT4728813.1 trypsin-like peptidase domain-containing protein [Klebsiella quasipneumoniae subsp. similipneumoniae]